MNGPCKRMNVDSYFTPTSDIQKLIQNGSNDLSIRAKAIQLLEESIRVKS